MPFSRWTIPTYLPFWETRMPLGDHPTFNRPPVTTPLWRYVDVAKFVDLVASGQLWLTSAELLASNDPYEGLPGAIRFPHRMWRSIDDVPEQLRVQILNIYGRSADTPEAAFRGWFMIEEQRCIMEQSAMTASNAARFF